MLDRSVHHHFLNPKNCKKSGISILARNWSIHDIFYETCNSHHLNTNEQVYTVYFIKKYFFGSLLAIWSQNFDFLSKYFSKGVFESLIALFISMKWPDNNSQLDRASSVNMK